MITGVQCFDEAVVSNDAGCDSTGICGNMTCGVPRGLNKDGKTM